MYRRIVLALIATCLCGNALASRLVFLAERRWPGISELFLVDLDLPATNLALSRPYAAGSANNRVFNGVSTFAISPDGRYVV